jgi:hypothetical protein
MRKLREGQVEIERQNASWAPLLFCDTSHPVDPLAKINNCETKLR